MTYSTGKVYVKPKDFIAIWQNADSVDEVVAKTGFSKNTLYKRAQYYRDRGIDLKKFRNAPNSDWIELDKAAKSYHINKVTCPHCKGQELFSHVTKRKTEEGPIYRQRLCNGCGNTFASYELSAEDFNFLLGMQGTSENLLHIMWKRSGRGRDRIEKEKLNSKPEPVIPAKNETSKLPLTKLSKRKKEFISKFGKDKLVV